MVNKVYRFGLDTTWLRNSICIESEPRVYSFFTTPWYTPNRKTETLVVRAYYKPS
jgi:hypothetical protein